MEPLLAVLPLLFFVVLLVGLRVTAATAGLWSAGACLAIAITAFALVSVLLLARLMVHSGMIEVLSISAATAAGAYWPAVSPIVGAVGPFVTGSATASNILFTDLHVTVSSAEGLTPTAALAGQGFGAAIGNIVAPHNIIAGAATVGLIEREAALLKLTIPICVGYAVLGGFAVLLISQGA